MEELDKVLRSMREADDNNRKGRQSLLAQIEQKAFVGMQELRTIWRGLYRSPQAVEPKMTADGVPTEDQSSDEHNAADNQNEGGAA